MPASKRWPEQVLEHLPTLLVVLDETGRVRFGNRQAETFLAELSPEYRQVPLDAIFPALKGEAFPLGWKEARMLQAAGRDLIAFAGKIPDQPCSGWTVMILHALSDIEPVNRELLIIKKELEQIFDCSYDEIFTTDSDGTALRVSAGACERLYGVKPDQIIGRNVKELEAEGFFRPSVFERVVREKRRITAIQDNKMGQKTIVTANPVLDEDGNVLRVVSNSRDITEFISLSEQLQETEQQIQRFYRELVKIKQEAKAVREFVAESPNMRSAIEMAQRVARFDSTVLLLGESGVGKDLVAKLIHRLSPRSKGPYLKINCGAIPDTLLESELFGYTPGAFTGALKEGKKGLIEEAQGGTLYMDEIGEMPYYLQVKLLQVIEEKVVLSVGSAKPKAVDIRIIAATNKDLKEMASRNAFREDLYYRLNVVSLHLPPLRERPEDLRTLCGYFIERFNRTFNTRKSISPEVMKAFLAYAWPGNVRELENLIERFLVMADEEVMQPCHLPEYILDSPVQGGRVSSSGPARSVSAGVSGRAAEGNPPRNHGHGSPLVAKEPAPAPASPGPELTAPLKEAVEKAEKEALLEAFTRYGRAGKVAEVLGISQSTLVRRLKKYGYKLDPAKMTLPVQE